MNWYARVYPDKVDTSDCSQLKRDVSSKYKEGLKVRDRRVSLSMPQVKGTIVSNKKGVLTIEWDYPNDKEKQVEKFDFRYDVPEIERRISIVGEG